MAYDTVQVEATLRFLYSTSLPPLSSDPEKRSWHVDVVVAEVFMVPHLAVLDSAFVVGVRNIASKRVLLLIACFLVAGSRESIVKCVVLMPWSRLPVKMSWSWKQNQNVK